MFGYIKPLRCQLRVGEDEAYKAYYCGLCRALRGRYGMLARNVLSYDATFLAVLCGSLNRQVPTARPRRCFVHPFKKRPMLDADPALAFAADANLALAYNKARDDWRDEKSKKARLALWLYRRAYKKAKRHNPAVVAAVERWMDALDALEKANCDAEDVVADCFANMLRDLAACMPAPPRAAPALRQTGYNIGRWLYILDAWDDLAENETSGAYNVFLLRRAAGESCAAQAERVEFGLYASLEAASLAFELLPFLRHRELLRNILYQGMDEQTRKVLCDKTLPPPQEGEIAPGIRRSG